jgi:hypothetical protein
MTRTLSSSLPPGQRSADLRRRSDPPIDPIRQPQWAGSSIKWTESFKYIPLDLAERSIRVLEVLPRTAPVQLVSCRLTHQPLNNSTHIALSYTWGPHEPKFPIEINSTLFFVRANLHDFFTHTDVVGKLLWIDAICIDQSNTAERVNQVQLMDKIYSQAKNVIVWLGCGDEEIRGALKQAADYHDTNEVSDSDKDSSTNHGHPNRPKTILDHAVQTHLHPFWNSYERICSLPYWTRVWILQEVILSDNVTIFYDDSRCCWRCFVYVIERSFEANGLQRLANSPAYHVFRLKESQNGPAPPKNLPFILKQSLGSSCSDFHDRIFGILGLLERAEVFHIDYSQSEVELSVTTALFYIQGMTLEDGLYRASFKETRALGDILQDLLFRRDVQHISTTFRGSHLPLPRSLDWGLPLNHYKTEYRRTVAELFVTYHPTSHNLEFRNGDIVYQYGFPNDNSEAKFVLVTRSLKGVERVIARAHHNGEAGSVPAVEYYDDSMGLADGLPGAFVRKNGSILQTDNTFTTAILCGISEDTTIRQICVPVMINIVLQWQRESAKSKSAS